VKDHRSRRGQHAAENKTGLRHCPLAARQLSYISCVSSGSQLRRRLRQRSVTLTFIEFVIPSLLNLWGVSGTHFCGLRCEPRADHTENNSLIVFCTRRGGARKAIVGRTAGKEVGCYIAPYRSSGWHRGHILFVATLCTACILLFASEARSQCTARDVLQNQPRLKKTPSASRPQILVRSAVDVPVWKTITVGTFADLFALGNALDAAGCGIGNSAGEILARPTFRLSVTKTSIELFAVSAAELGFQTDTASLADIYARAQQLGFGLAAAEIGPQLRLQYFDQPIGEFLIIGMEPIRTWTGEPLILTVANGGAGLLIGQDGSPDAQISLASRFLFVRSNKPAPAKGPEAAALVDP
jgi:hypothetical protein